MKKMMILALALTGALVACNGNKEQKDALADTTQPDISKVEGQRDSLMNLIGDISQNLLEVNRMENILVSGDFKDTPDKRQEIIANINALRQELDARKQALEELESKLKSSNGYSAKLQKTIESQKQLIGENLRFEQECGRFEHTSVDRDRGAQRRDTACRQGHRRTQHLLLCLRKQQGAERTQDSGKEILGQDKDHGGRFRPLLLHKSRQAQAHRSEDLRQEGGAEDITSSWIILDGDGWRNSGDKD